MVMKAPRFHLNRVVASLLAIWLCATTATAQSADLDDLFTRLQSADARAAMRIEREIWTEWSKSGSPAMDLLLERGRAALQAGDAQTAIGHLTALTDHAPDFAEGWNARATAYFQAGEYGPALQDIGRTLTLNPRHFGALSGLAAIFEQMDRPDQALEAYKAALAIHPHLRGVEEAVDRLEAKAAGQEL
jgi:tetratricopeptide (TPR) repeat protein